MDNITHSLLGAVVGETLARFTPITRSLLPDSTRRGLYVTLMVVGSNLPDLDSLYAGITGGKLGYLLHHRGHTHTIVGALLIALLVYCGCVWWLRRRHIDTSPHDRRRLACVALLAPLLHVAMDFLNEYGVHPFWPLNNDWFYGDAVFIVEPLFWAAAAPLVFLLQRRVSRGLVGLILLVGAGLSFGSGLVPLPLALALTLLTLGLLYMGWKSNGRYAALAALTASFGIIALFAVSAQSARTAVRTLGAAQYPQATALDYVLAPMPVNPLCWDVIALQLEGDAYTLRQAVLSLAPGWISAGACPGPGLGAPTTLSLVPSGATDSTTIEWLNEATLSRREAQALFATNCEAQGFAGFARALWFRREGNGWLVGDLRYDREPGLGFAEMEVAAEPGQCPRFVPPWTWPRSDLLL